MLEDVRLLVGDYLGVLCTFLALMKYWRAWMKDAGLFWICKDLLAAFVNALLSHGYAF
jgi:hypothetical protein